MRWDVIKSDKVKKFIYASDLQRFLCKIIGKKRTYLKLLKNLRD